MVKVETTLKRLHQLIGKKLKLDQLESILFDLGMEIDDYNKSTDEIKIEITAERPDMISPQGIARVIKAFLGLKTKDYSAKKPLKDFKVIIEKSVSKVRPYTACAIVKGLKLNDDAIKEIIWVQEKLHSTFGRNRKKVAIGIYPLEKIKLPIYYRAEKPEKIKFKPLEAPYEMDANEILESHPTGQKYAHLLEKYEKYPIFIDSNNEILSLPPIINSEKTGRVDEKTKDVFIECSGYNFLALKQTLNILVTMLNDMGGDVYQMELNYGKKIISPDLSFEERKISLSYIKEITGLNLSIKEAKKLFEKMMYKVKNTSKDSLTVLVPNIRTDIWHNVDLCDDIVRAYGVNNIKFSLPKVATDAHILKENKIKAKITELMIGLGYQELFTLGLSDKKEQYEMMNIKEQNHIKLGHTAEQSINMVRTWLLPEMIKFLFNNKSKEYPHKVFEINYVVKPNEKKDVLSENILKMCCAYTNNTANFTSIKQVLVYLLESFGFDDYKFEELKHDSFISGRCAKVIVNKKDIGFIGELHPQVLLNFGLSLPMVAFEIELDKLFTF